MKITMKHALAAVLMGLCLTAVSGAAGAESDTARKQLALRQACTEQGGRFEQSWIYNDQGMQWGEVLSCSTSAGYVTCQDNVCRGGRWAFDNNATAAKTGPDDSDGAVRFPAEPASFSAALSQLSGN